MLAVFENITDSTQSADERLSATAVDLAAKAIDVDIDDVGVRLNAHAPDFLEDHGAGDDAASVAAEVFKEHELLRGELEGLAGAGGFAAEEVELEVLDMEAGGLAGLRGVALEQIAQAGEEFGEGEGLGEVIVAALFKAADAIVDGTACGEDEDGCANAGLAQAEDEVDAVHVRQAEVDDEDVIGVGGGEAFRGFAVRRHVHNVAGLSQSLTEKGLDIVLVLNQQEAHAEMVMHGEGSRQKGVAGPRRDERIVIAMWGGVHF